MVNPGAQINLATSANLALVPGRLTRSPLPNICPRHCTETEDLELHTTAKERFGDVHCDKFVHSEEGQGLSIRRLLWQIADVESLEVFQER